MPAHGGDCPDLTRYELWMRAAGLSPHTVRLRLLVASRVAGLDEDGVAGWLASGDWSPATRAAYAREARTWHAWATAHGIEDSDPTAGLRLPRMPAGQPRPIPRDALASSLLRADPMQRRCLMLGCLAGLRRAEMAAAHSGDIDGGRLLVRGKGGRQRWLPLHPALACDLAGAAGWLLPGRDGGQRSPQSVADFVRPALAPWGLHSLRHRFATDVYRDTGDILLVSRLLGHRSVATTMIYCQVPDESMRLAVGHLALAA